MHDSPLCTPARAHARGRPPPHARRCPGQAGGAEGHCTQAEHHRLGYAGTDVESRERRAAVRGGDRERLWLQPGARRRDDAEPALRQQQDAAQRRVLLACPLDRQGHERFEVVGRAQVHQEVERRGGAADACEPEHDRLSEPRDPHVGVRAGSFDVPRVDRGRRGRRRRRRPRWDHLQGRARVGRQRQSDHHLEHQPRRLDVAAPGHLLLAGRAGRRRGQCRSAVRDPLVRVDVGGHDDAHRHGHGAGRRDLRPALPVGADSRRRELRAGDQHHVGLRNRLQVVQREDRRDLVRADPDAAEQHVLLARPRPRPPGPGRPLEQRPDLRQDLRPDRGSRSAEPDGLRLEAPGDSARRQRGRAGRHVVDGARRPPLRAADGLR